MDEVTSSEPKSLTISRAALKVDLLELEMRLREYFTAQLAGKADSAYVVQVEARVTAVVAEFTSRHESLSKEVTAINERQRLKDERERARQEARVEQKDDSEHRFNRWQTLIGRSTALVAVLVTIYLTHP